MRVINHRQFARSKPRPQRWRRIILWSAAAVATVLVLGNGVLWAMYRNKVLPHYYVGAAAVGGVAFDDISSHVTAQTVLPSHMKLTAGSTSADVSPAALGIHPDIPATIAALKATRPWLPMMSLVMHHTVPVQAAVDDAAFTNTAIALQKTFARTPVGSHVAYDNGIFRVAAPEDGYSLNVTGLKTAVATAAATGKTSVTVPTITLQAPATPVDLQPDVQKLQKQLATSITFVYGAKTHKPTAADIGSWYAADGTTMAPSRPLISQYVQTAAKQLGVAPMNADEAATASIYAITTNQKIQFRLVAGQGTTVFKYCAAQRGLDDSVLEAFKLKLAATYGDPRGWNDNGKVGFIYSDSGCQLHAWLAAPATMTGFGSICDDYYSCTVYPNVIINNDRWNGATDPWNAQHLGIEDYQAMAINHESGHWLGFGHTTCPGAGQPAPVMQQQSVNLGGCTFNPWPVTAEFQQLDQSLHLTAWLDRKGDYLIAGTSCACGHCTGVGSQA